MRRLSRSTIAALAAVGAVLTPGIAAAAPAPEGALATWNCRQVTATDITFYAYSTGGTVTWPYKLYSGDRFRSHGYYNGRYRAETWGKTYYGYWGYATADSRWVTQVPDSYCY